MYSNFYTKFFLLSLLIKNLIESLLDKKNYEHIKKNRDFVPVPFASKISLIEHQKAADYTCEKINTNRIFHFIDLLFFLGWTLGGGIEALNQFSINFGKSETITGIIFLGLLGLISSLLSLPQSLYFTFILEEKYGFNKTTWKIFISDLVKGAILAVLIGGPLAYTILVIMEKLGTLWWLYAFLFLSAFQLLLIFLYPSFIAPLFNKFQELPNGVIKEKIIALLTRTGFKSSGIFIMDASKRSGHGNAYFTGFGTNKRVVFFDTLLNSLEADEIESVLAHELGHMKKKHILKGMIKGFIFSFLGFMILGILKNNPAFFIGHGVLTVTNATALTLFSFVIGVYTFLLTPLNSWLSRKNEFEADEFASQNASAAKLISALIKMYKDNASTLTPDPTYSQFYFSHPPALERVAFLEKFKT
jgi:STE24 endopeptidase